jgi:hypothetical protein
VIAAKVADPPTDFSLISSSATTINFGWTPAYNGGTPITHYKIFWDAGSGSGVFTQLAFTNSPTSSFLVNNGLTSGTFYNFKVVAVNVVGDSVQSNAVKYIAASVPSVPGKPYSTSTSTSSIGIAWTAALENGSTISLYNVYSSVN